MRLTKTRLPFECAPPPGYKPAGAAVFLPGTAVVSDAAIVELKPNDRVDVGNLRLAGR